jgi:hypothetical protein
MSRDPEPDEHEEDGEMLSAEEETELARRLEASEEAERAGELIAWEALFPPKRLVG